MVVRSMIEVAGTSLFVFRVFVSQRPFIHTVILTLISFFPGLSQLRTGVQQGKGTRKHKGSQASLLSQSQVTKVKGTRVNACVLVFL